MKRCYLLLIVLAFGLGASAQLLKTEKDPKTGQETRSAVVVLASGHGMQLNFFARGEEMLVEIVVGGTLEGYPMKLLKTMAIHLKLKNDSLCHFPLDTTKYTALKDDVGLLRLSLVAVVKPEQLIPLLNSQVKAVSLGFAGQADLAIPPISDNNRREIKKAVAYIVGDKK